MVDQRIQEMCNRLNEQQSLIFNLIDELEEKGERGVIGWEFGKEAEDVCDKVEAWHTIEGLLSDVIALIQASFLNHS